MKQIVITGSRGFVGSYVSSILPFPFDEVDLSIGSDHSSIKGREGTLIFLSSWISETESYTNPNKYIKNNLIGLTNLLTQNSFDEIIFPSSYAVYDKKGDINPKSVYGITKFAGEKLVQLYTPHSWILRIGNPYGVGDRRSVLYQLAQCKKYGKVFTLYKMNDLKKDFFHIIHLAHIIRDILEGVINPGTYNVGTGVGEEVSPLLKSICVLNQISYRVINSPTGLSDAFIPTENLLRVEKGNVLEDWKTYL